MLAVLTVNSLGDNPADTSALTLRDAITLVNNSGNAGSLGQSGMPAGWASQISGEFGSNDMIQFDPSLFGATQETIALDSGSGLFSNTNLAIIGPGENKLAIDGTASEFFTTFGTTSITGLTLSSVLNGGEMTLADSRVTAGVSSGGTMSITHCTISGAQGPGIDAGGRMTIVDSTISGNELGILCSGTMTITGSTISENVEHNNAYYVGGDYLSAGGILVRGSMTIIDSTIANNQDNDPIYPGAGGIVNGGTLRAGRKITSAF
ncbi:MAG TPA: right-handed parallel beta-helix repeat-containing protein [Pirellulales bacterium]|nr:right-handed parallel beta-helix repeat-containing protein [Pirellulales bacterium]